MLPRPQALLQLTSYPSRSSSPSSSSSSALFSSSRLALRHPAAVGPGTRLFSTTPPLDRPSSPFLNLSALSNSRETTHLSRERRLPRTEFAPALQLLRASEVDPFAPAPGASAEARAKARAKACTAAQNGAPTDGSPRAPEHKARLELGALDASPEASPTASALIPELVADVRHVRRDLDEALLALGRAQARVRGVEREGVRLVVGLLVVIGVLLAWPGAPAELGRWVREPMGEGWEEVRRRVGSGSWGQSGRVIGRQERDGQTPRSGPNINEPMSLVEKMSFREGSGDLATRNKKDREVEAAEVEAIADESEKDHEVSTPIRTRLFWAGPT